MQRRSQGATHRLGDTRGATIPPDRLLWVRSDLDSVTEPIVQQCVQFEARVDDAGLARVARLAVDDVVARRASGNRPYAAQVGNQIVAYGWCCWGTAECGPQNLPLTMSDGHRYLWDFATVPEWRGHGVYPALLTWIVLHETSGRLFWIMHNRANTASQRGIAKAGFRFVAALNDRLDGRFELNGFGNSEWVERARFAFGDLIQQPAADDRGSA